MKKLLAILLLLPTITFAGGYFPTGSNFLTAGDRDNLDGSATMSWCAWYYIDFTATLSITPFGIMDKRTNFSTQNAWSMGNDYGGLMGANFGIVVSSAGNNEAGMVGTSTLQATTPIKAKKWQHVCYTYNGNRTNDNWRMYINAIQVDNPAQTQLNAAIFNSTTAVCIGGVNACSYTNTNAPLKLYDLRIYSRELSYGEVKMVYSGLPVQNGLSARWLMTRNTATEPDISSSKDGAVLTGTINRVGSPPVGRYRR